MVEGMRRRRRARERLAAGNKAYQALDYDLAAVAFREAIELGFGSPVARINLGLALYKGGHRREAKAEWESALALVDRGRRPYLEEQVRILLRQFN
jgi:Flp pilus assembly protein TadD